MTQEKNRIGRPPKIDAFRRRGIVTEFMRVAIKIDTNSVKSASELVLGFIKPITEVTRTAIIIFVIVEVRAATACRKVFMKMFSLKVWQRLYTPESEK